MSDRWYVEVELWERDDVNDVDDFAIPLAQLDPASGFLLFLHLAHQLLQAAAFRAQPAGLETAGVHVTLKGCEVGQVLLVPEWQG